MCRGGKFQPSSYPKPETPPASCHAKSTFRPHSKDDNKWQGRAELSIFHAQIIDFTTNFFKLSCTATFFTTPSDNPRCIILELSKSLNKKI